MYTFMNVHNLDVNEENGCARKAQKGPVPETPPTSNIWMFLANVQLLL